MKNHPQSNLVLLLSGTNEDGSAYSYSYTLESLRPSTGKGTYITYAEAKQKLYEKVEGKK